MQKRFLITATILGGVICIGFFLFYLNFGGRHDPTPSSYILQEVVAIRSGLQFYAQEHEGRLPPTEQCMNTKVLKTLLTPKYLSRISSGPSGWPGVDYGAGVDASGKKFVVRASGETAGLLKDFHTDLDGIVFGCACDDPAFCVTAEVE